MTQLFTENHHPKYIVRIFVVGICLTHQTTIPSMRGWKTILGT
jgi:hypothetical protein